MAMLDVFFPAVRRHITGPLDLMMREAILEASMSFCRESLFCRGSKTLPVVSPGQVYQLCDEAEPVKCVKRLQVLLAGDDPRLLTAGDDFSSVTANDMVFLRPLEKVTIIFALQPRRGATDVPDVLADDYTDVIAAGALEQLFLMLNQPWSDPQRATYFHAIFIEGCRRAYRDAADNSPINGFSNPVRRHEFY